jgi:hypothetical protein
MRVSPLEIRPKVGSVDENERKEISKIANIIGE